VHSGCTNLASTKPPTLPEPEGAIFFNAASAASVGKLLEPLCQIFVDPPIASKQDRISCDKELTSATGTDDDAALTF
jgi:hypothetical protein